MSTELSNQIREEIKKNPIILYIKGEKDIPMCGFSSAVLGVFKELQVPFETRNTLQNLEEYRQALKEITEWHTIPQIFLGGEFIGGCDITLELYSQGELKKMVEAALQSQPTEES